MDTLKHYCGIFGSLSTNDYHDEIDIAHIIYLGLVSLQHRGQECAGIVTSFGGSNDMKVLKIKGLVSHTITSENLTGLNGHYGIGHTRYSTQAGTDMINCQPFVVHTTCGQIAIAHNGELMNAKKLRKKIQVRGVGLSTSSDSELIAQLLSTPMCSEESYSDPDWKHRIINFMKESLISYSLLLLHEHSIWAVRDPFGNRPLCIGKIDDELDANKNDISKHKPLSWVIASESCSFGPIGAKYYREVEPGEIVKITRTGVQSVYIMNAINNPDLNIYPAFCLFEYIYFARSDSLFEGQLIYSVRYKCGQELAKEWPVLHADLISTVPDSATPAALGFAQESGVPYLEVLTKNPYIGRTFIQPSTRLRKLSVSKKFGVLSDNIKNKRIVLIDDSIVRGTTIQPIIKLLKDNGAKEVHIRVSSPPVKHPCFMGINIPTSQELIANKYTVPEMAAVFGADSIAYLSLQGLKSSVSKNINKNGIKPKTGYCGACFTGDYPVPLEW
ncbi:unnamed protein product [Gordionus sp. m RMFG-2023]